MKHSNVSILLRIAVSQSPEPNRQGRVFAKDLAEWVSLYERAGSIRVVLRSRQSRSMSFGRQSHQGDTTAEFSRSMLWAGLKAGHQHQGPFEQ